MLEFRHHPLQMKIILEKKSKTKNFFANKEESSCLLQKLLFWIFLVIPTFT